jgi:outer membrane protein OmpA-like peptidoglycan-associated protein
MNVLHVSALQRRLDARGPRSFVVQRIFCRVIIPLCLAMSMGSCTGPITKRHTRTSTEHTAHNQQSGSSQSTFTDSLVIARRTCMLPPDASYRDDTPLVTADGRTLFLNSTRFDNRPWATLNSDSTRYDDDIYFIQRIDSNKGENDLGEEQWSQPVNLGVEINTSEDDGIVSISPTADALYFCSLKQNFEKDGGPFYYAEREEKHWSKIKGMGGGLATFFHNRDRGMKFLIYGASINARATSFYFATTLHSRRGQHEIWVSRRRNYNDKWGYPENLGPTINNTGGSYSPFIAADDRTLYFASGRSGGFGGDDLYVSTLQGKEWSEPKNLGPTINTGGNDAFLSIPASADRIYYINGNGGGICSVPLPKQFRPMSTLLHTGIVNDRDNGRPLAATLNVNARSKGDATFNIHSNKSGRYSLALELEQTYGISITVPGYIPDTLVYDVLKNPNLGRLPPFIRLTKYRDVERGILTNVLFDYNADTLNRAERPELLRIVDLLRSDTAMVIEVRGYTDSRGSLVYNQRLSQRRAEAVWRFLVSTDPASRRRVVLRGFGPENPRGSNDTEEGRRLNRRVEVTLSHESRPAAG